ncbi:MAG: prepilin-type N-terminal cleavage/methylation domain-containing protein [Gammaproteobacteria bacterium]|nr:prepilin-type N-terminal cleavage/methylation domain-containing protein [Gammaproteobacteria bacterium]
MSHSRALPSRIKQQGMTLIEVMISITISLVLLAGVLQIFASNKATYRVQDAMARVQEGGRFAIHFLTKDLRVIWVAPALAA